MYAQTPGHTMLSKTYPLPSQRSHNTYRETDIPLFFLNVNRCKTRNHGLQGKKQLILHQAS